MAEVDELCDRIGILKNGKIAFLGISTELTETGKKLFLLKMRFTQHIDLDMLPVTWGFQAMCTEELQFGSLYPLLIIAVIALVLSILKLRKISID